MQALPYLPLSPILESINSGLHQQADVSSHWSASFYRLADQSEVG